MTSELRKLAESVVDARSTLTRAQRSFRLLISATICDELLSYSIFLLFQQVISNAFGIIAKKRSTDCTDSDVVPAKQRNDMQYCHVSYAINLVILKSICNLFVFKSNNNFEKSIC